WGQTPGSFIWSMCSRTTTIVDALGNPVATPYVSGVFACGAVGTSLSTPHVSGLAALLIAQNGKVGPVKLTSLITQSAVDMAKPGIDPFYGWGHIDVARAIGK